MADGATQRSAAGLEGPRLAGSRLRPDLSQGRQGVGLASLHCRAEAAGPGQNRSGWTGRPHRPPVTSSPPLEPGEGNDHPWPSAWPGGQREAHCLRLELAARALGSPGKALCPTSHRFRAPASPGEQTRQSVAAPQDEGLAAVLLALLWCRQQGAWQGAALQREGCPVQAVGPQVTQPGDVAWGGGRECHLRRGQRRRVGLCWSPRVPKPPSPAPTRRQGRDPPHPIPPSLSLLQASGYLPSGAGVGAVKGQRLTPSVVGKDAARSTTSQEVGPGFRDSRQRPHQLGEGQGGQRLGRDARPREGRNCSEPVSSAPG